MRVAAVRVAVVSANLGGHDDWHPIAEQTIAADWYAFSDDLTNTPKQTWLNCWLTGLRLDSPDPRLYAKRYRMTPWEFVGKDYDFIVWIDASTEVTSPHFLADAIAAADNACPLTTWKHSHRDNINAEAIVCLDENAPKYGPMRRAMLRQVSDYGDAGFDVCGPPLYATGTLVWNMASGGQPRDLGAAWLAECEKHTTQDQISLPFVAWAGAHKVGTFPFSQIECHGNGLPGNRWLRYHPHRRVT